MIREIKIPEIGENVKSGLVVAVHIKIGDTIDVDDTIIELETDKALVEIPSPFAGTVTQILAGAGMEMTVGEVIARMDPAAQDESTTETHGDEKRSQPETEGEPEAPPSRSDDEESGEKKDLSASVKGSETQKAADDQPVPASPSIRRLARGLGVDIRDVAGNGSGGRITEQGRYIHVRERLASDRSKALKRNRSRFWSVGRCRNFGDGNGAKADGPASFTSWMTIPHRHPGLTRPTSPMFCHS